MQFDCVVGYGDKSYPGYRQLTRAELLNRAIRQRLLEVHAHHSGFPLAEPNLVVKDLLCVAEGVVAIDASCIAGVALTLRGVYTAMNGGTQVVWTATPPPLDGKWIVHAGNIRDSPCLFVRSVRRVSMSRTRVVFFFFTFCLFFFTYPSLTYLDICIRSQVLLQVFFLFFLLATCETQCGPFFKI